MPDGVRRVPALDPAIMINAIHGHRCLRKFMIRLEGRTLPSVDFLARILA